MHAAKKQGGVFKYVRRGRLGGHLNSCHLRVEHAEEHDALVDRDSKSGKLEGEGKVVW